ncbi:GGDEF domain-containing protein [Ruminococcus sp. Marseille-P6503]|uniref:GGDEF domain-containing protein n=1 Tax=Ruminococcus sp. Marseille-P6503 TaxID=2364796 RepID=UPI0013DDCB38|nr:GGDEF domain-containing protein [Ruminococcus sp. Marseille-P6503]
MIEEKLRKRLRRSIITVLCIIVVLLICSGLFSAYMHSVRNNSVKEQVILEAEEYKTRIIKQLEADFQTLSTISAFIDSSYANDKKLLAEHLDKSNQSNTFLTIVFYDLSGNGVISTLGQQPVVNASLSELSSEGQRVIKLAMEGTTSVSQLFESLFSDSSVFVYSMPIYDGDEIIGALGASDHIEIFSDILSGNTVLGGGGYIHMLNADGNFLIRSSKMIVQEKISSIFDGPYISEDSKSQVTQALQNQERIFSSFSYEGESYPFLLEPVGINGWYLFCVNTGEGLSANLSASAMVTQVTFVVVLILVIFLMLYGYRLLRNYNRDMMSLAYYDSLTGAENLSRFRQRLNESLGNSGGSVAAVSIRQFPFINEIFGKERANKLLCQIKEITERHLNNDEFFCHDTSDRFYIFFRETEAEVVRNRLNSLISEFERSAEISKTNYQLAFYCGVVDSPKCSDPEETADCLMTHVQFALDRAKGAHSSKIWFFDSELHIKEELENYIESHMHQALKDGEFKLFLQPKKDLHSGMLSGAEALVRWKTNDGRMIFPDQFIPLFERNGFCAKLDTYMLEQVCKQIDSWIKTGIEPIPISVNQSKLMFFESDYVGTLIALINKYNIPAQLITLEILEGLALNNIEEINAKILQLQGEGFRISLDDFGSGFSSLNTLGKLKIDELKLDRDFLLNASDQEQKRVRLIMQQTILMAGQLGISTVAEGVETPENEALICELGCDIGQGYLYSRPISAADFDKRYMKRADSRDLNTVSEG